MRNMGADDRARHPRGLTTLVLTELWERFSLYGMAAILVTFLAASPASEGMGLSAGTAEAVEGVYMAMISLLALPGGWLADRVLGARRAVLYGGLVIMAGHTAMAIPGNLGVWPGLVLITVGTGLLKPNISAMVGRLYAAGDEQRRDAGYSLFYMGINIGGTLSPLLVGYLGEEVSWHAGFGAAAIGMAIGLIQYAAGGRHFPDAEDRPCQPLTAGERRRALRATLGTLSAVALLFAVCGLCGALDIDAITFGLTIVAVIVPAAYLALMLRSPKITAQERARLKSYVWLFAAATVFWMIYDQFGSELNLFAAEKTDRHILGWEVPASWMQCLPSFFVILLAPLFAAFWTRRGRSMPTPLKFGLALILVGASFFVMAAASSIASGGVKVAVFWLIGTYLLQVTGELFLSPVGLSVTTRLAPKAFANQMMGVWFLAAATGDAIGGQLPRIGQSVLSQSNNFLWQGALALVVGGALIRYTRKLSAVMDEQTATTQEVTVAAA
ncbi:peptide MFS transporter [Streptomyces hiroshimensis]|nr:oligopeptide:H+ symporter [Streptomyces hiroshimensis]